MILQSSLPPAAANAEDATLDSRYKSLIKQGIEEYARGHWLEAKGFFEHAHALQPNARTLRGLGATSYELRLYVQAVVYLQAALESPARPLTGEMREAASQLIVQSRALIALYRLEANPASTSLAVDGQAPSFDAQGRLMLDAGPHQLVFAASGRPTLVRNVIARGGDENELRVDLLEPVAGKSIGSLSSSDASLESAREVTPPSQPPPSGPWGTQHWLAVGIGSAGAVTLAASGICSLLALSRLSDSRSDCGDDGCGPEGFAARDDARGFGDAASATVVAGALLLSAAAVIFFTAEPAGGTRETAVVAPVLAEHAWSVVVAGRL